MGSSPRTSEHTLAGQGHMREDGWWNMAWMTLAQEEHPPRMRGSPASCARYRVGSRWMLPEYHINSCSEAVADWRGQCLGMWNTRKCKPQIADDADHQTHPLPAFQANEGIHLRHPRDLRLFLNLTMVAFK